MSRGLWFVAGAGAGVYAMIRGRRAAEALTADGLRDRVGAAVVGARLFRDEVAQGKADAETDLRRRTGLGPHGVPELGVSTGSTNEARLPTNEARLPTNEAALPADQRRRPTGERHDPDPRLHEDKEGTS